ncbi:DsbA family oxidoreductase [Streptomyces zagrosensis]|uniref:Putative DsbA family dithiol-disulfide isomerase n=1 Tax=Streptomyces zagrosensis TaxID=1042984 RepID=A0A7W9Q9U3_9ACTN|nr:DsbA family oxidoreductase [Streptomyces zagrosensis]MBB5936293.1 putative DsbA family dithiol-disulfide isomerase [Streptomyces zagrosensis]
MRVEVWVDVLCPWGYIGKRRLERALARFDRRAEVEIVWRSLELDPGSPRFPGGPIADLLVEYGVYENRSAALRQFEMIGYLGQQEGLELHLATALPANSFDAHRLLQLAVERGLGDAMIERLLRGYLTENIDVADHAALVPLGREVGLDTAEMWSVLDSDAYAGSVLADRDLARERGVLGSPTFVVGGHAAPLGAPSVDTLLELLGQPVG